MISKDKFVLFLWVLFFLALLTLYGYYFPFFYKISRLFINITKNFWGLNDPSSFGKAVFIFLCNIIYPLISAYGYSSLVLKSFSYKNLIIFCLVLPFTSLAPLAKGIYFLFHLKQVLPIIYFVFLLEAVGIFIGISISINFYFKLKNKETLKLLEIKKIYFENLNLKFFFIVVFIYALSAYIETYYFNTYIMKHRHF